MSGYFKILLSVLILVNINSNSAHEEFLSFLQEINFSNELDHLFKTDYASVCNLWNQDRPDKPKTFEKYRNRLNINKDYKSDHHIISYANLNSFFTKLFCSAADNNSRVLLTQALDNFVRNNQMTEEEIRNKGVNGISGKMRAIRSLLIWNPGNLIPGPEGKYRADDPGSYLDTEILKGLRRLDPAHAKLIEEANQIVMNKNVAFNDKLKLFPIWKTILNKYETRVKWIKDSNGNYIVG